MIKIGILNMVADITIQTLIQHQAVQTDQVGMTITSSAVIPSTTALLIGVLLITRAVPLLMWSTSTKTIKPQPARLKKAISAAWLIYRKETNHENIF